MALAGGAILAAMVVVTVIWMATIRNGLDVYDQPIGADFIIYYSASSLTLHGEPPQAFNPERVLAVERMIVPGMKAGLRWCYPPTFQLLIAPLARLPYVAAFGVFMTATAALFLLTIQSIFPGRLSLLLTAAFPGAFVNFTCGQNGFLTASLLGFGLILLERRPWLAGAVLGLLVIKPQLALLLPILLLGTGRWKAALAAALTGGTFCAISWLVLGPAPWIEFFRTTAIVSSNLATGHLPWGKIPSLFVAVRWVGLGIEPAYGVQIAAGAVVAAVTLWAWRRSAPLDLKLALTVFATFLVSPYSFNYDLVVLAVPIALIARHGRTHALPPGAKLILLLAAFTPDMFLGFADLTHLQLMPVALLVCYAWVLALVVRSPDSAASTRATIAQAAASPSALSRSKSLSPGALISA
jgi:hypothetical protein